VIGFRQRLTDGDDTSAEWEPVRGITVALGTEVETVRRKNRLRENLSRGLAGLGFALYDMYLGSGELGSCAPPDRPGIEVDVRRADERDIEALVRLRGERAAQRFAGSEALGSRCFVAESEGTVVGHTWINTSVFEFLGAPLTDLPDGAMCIHDVFVFPESRGHRVLQQMLAAVFEVGRADGLRAAVCVVDTANTPALEAFRRVGVRFRRAPILKLPGRPPFLLAAKHPSRKRP
jgi:GNAT superfamily N-acetyltransferase